MGRFKILLISLPLALLVVAAKAGLHALEWEPLSPAMMPLFTASVTGVIFLLGFILAGVITDYKESEKVPGEMATSLWALWQEMEIAARGPAAAEARAFQEKLAAFVASFRLDTLQNRNDARTLALLDSLTGDVAALDRGVPAAFMARVRAEHTALRRLLTRIRVIRDTDFAVSVSLLVKGIVALFIAAMLLLRFQPAYVGSLFVFFYSFILISILRIIGDMDDPFEYEEGGEPVDEIDFFPVWELEREMRAALEKKA